MAVREVGIVKPNIIFIMTDQQRWDSLACNGNDFASTPNIDALAAQGVRCTNSFTPWPVCSPARATVWTGVYPHKHKVQFNVYGIENAFEEYSDVKTTLFHILRDTGYKTAYFGKWHLGEGDPGMFDVWRGFNSLGGHWVDAKPNGVYKPDQQTDQLIDFMGSSAKSDRPFFATIGYYPPHDPYTAPERFYALYRNRGVPYAGYYAAVSAIDHCVGRIITTLTELGIAENTIVLYFSDHGDTFFYREEGEHKFVCHEEAIRVPLIVKWPERIQGDSVLPQVVGLQDLMPTVLDWIELEIPEGLHGSSFAPLLDGDGSNWREHYYVQNITFTSKYPERCIRSKDWKLILNTLSRKRPSRNLLYNLGKDPEEELNIYDTPREDKHDRFRHVTPSTETIAELAHKLRAQARQIKDDLGIELADICLYEMEQRLRSQAGDSVS